ncbi:hypothetical protein JOS77_20720 [Chromobacterium haemolyticum]|nr:hypothetical protein JOS77_20720 [Chromobacterium haemolyticum]
MSHDPRELQGLGPDAIRERLYTRSEDLPEGVQRLPLKTVHINKSPFVVANLKVLSPERAAHWDLDMEQVQRHADYAGALPDLTPVWRKVYKRESGEPRDVDENLYGGFVSNNDRKVLTKLRRMSADQLAGEMAFFEDPQLAELLFRYRARNFPRSLSGEEQQRWQTWRQAKLNGGPGRDFQQFRQELAEARAGELNEQAQSVLAQLEAYAAQL